MFKSLLRWLDRVRARRAVKFHRVPCTVEQLEARNLPVAWLPSDAPAFVDIKDTAYPIPCEAVYFVAPNGSADNLGTIDSPWTVQKAISDAPAGSTIIFRGGEYRGVDNLSMTRRLTLQPYPHERAWIKGSTIVTGWVADGPVWRKEGWVYEFPHLLGPEYLDPAFPLAGNRDMLFIDGRARTQVGSLTEVVPDTFYVDYANDRLYIGDDPMGRTVESTVSAAALVTLKNSSADATGTIIRGLGFTHYADYGVDVLSPHNRIENNTFVWNGQQGIRILGQSGGVSEAGVDAVVRGNIFTANGRKGVGTGRSHRLLLEGNTLSYNNVERYSATFDAAGIKLVRTNDMVLRDNLVERNYATGIWMDISCVRAAVVRNVSRFNRGLADRAGGIFAELQHDSIIAFNVSYGNGTGVVVADSSNIRVYNNTLADNGQAVIVRDSTRVNADPTEYAAGITWITRDVVVRNNLFSDIRLTGPTGPQFDASPTAGDDPSVLMMTGLDFNAYYRSNPARPASVVRWDPGLGAAVGYATVAAFRAVYPEYEANALVIDGGPNPFFVDGAAGDFRLRPKSLAVLRGEPLPADIAAAAGLIAGVPIHLGALGIAGELLPLHVASFTPTTDGVNVQFNRPIDPGVLNLYDTQTGGLGPADITVVGEASGPVRGSLILHPGNMGITFIATGAILPADTYRVTLRSSVNGFKDASGGLLDGNGDGTPGDPFTTTFPVNPSAGVVVSVPDFVRGPGQPVDVPVVNPANDLPLRLSDGAGVTCVHLSLTWNPDLLRITGATVGNSVPAGATVTFTSALAGTAELHFWSPTPLDSGAVDFVRLTAVVPENAFYGSKHLLNLHQVLLNDGTIAARDDDGLHVVGYLGDTTGNAAYSSADATRTLRVAVGLDSGFDAWQLADPVLLADLTGNGTINATDATRLLQEVLGIDRPEVPPLPGILPPLVPGGPDPLLNLPRFKARPGTVLTVPVLLDLSDGLETADLALSYDTRRLEVVDVQRGSLTGDFDLFATSQDSRDGTIRAGLGRWEGPLFGRGSGSVLTITFRVRAGAPAGRAAINLLHGLGPLTTQLNEGGLDLIPDPSDEEGDVLDGLIVVLGDHSKTFPVQSNGLGRNQVKGTSRIDLTDAVFAVLGKRQRRNTLLQ